jgi:uncharacterized protein YPO0396
LPDAGIRPPKQYAFNLAVIAVGLRDFEEAFEWLNKSIDDRSIRYDIMEHAFEELHRDARFGRLRMRLGIGKR